MLTGFSCIAVLGGLLAAAPTLVAADGGAALPLDGGPVAPVNTFRWDVPNVVSSYDIPGVHWAMGVPVKMHAVTVKGKMDDTMRALYDSFVRQGLFIDNRQLMGPMLTGVDTETLITYTAIFQENAPGYITVVLGEANVLKSRVPMGNDFVPLFPGARGVLRSSMEGADIIAYRVEATREEKVRAFYLDILPKSGFQPDPKDALTFQKGGEQVSIRLKQQNGDVSVFVSRRGKPSP